MNKQKISDLYNKKQSIEFYQDRHQGIKTLFFLR
jgi:hypothetical protein